jgi:hypothetical protein
MKKVGFVFCLLNWQWAISQQQPSKITEAFRFVDSTFTSPVFTFEVNELLPFDSLQAIMTKLNNAIAANKEWVTEYMNKNYKPGEGVPYNEKFGITREEYDKIKAADGSSYTLHKVSSENVMVVKTDSAIGFRGADSFRIIGYLKFSQEYNAVFFGEDTIPFSAEINATSASPFGQWHGYSWRYEKSNQPSNADIDIHRLSAKIIEIDIGKTIPGNRTLLRIEYEEVEQGEKRAYMELMGFIDNR